VAGFGSVRSRWGLVNEGASDEQLLRHTHSALTLRAGIHPEVVSERLGHTTISITLDTYSHAIPAMQEEAAALVAGPVFAT